MFAFQSCASLSSICLPSCVQVLGEGCFSQCATLSMVKFETNSKLSSIGKFVFQSCPSLSSICIPSSVRLVGEEHFCSHCLLLDDGEVLAISGDLLADFGMAVRSLAGLSVGAGSLSEASVPQLVGTGFSNVAAIAVAADIPVKQIAEIQGLLADGESVTRLAATATEMKGWTYWFLSRVRGKAE
jgi:hypothetical protein